MQTGQSSAAVGFRRQKLDPTGERDLRPCDLPRRRCTLQPGARGDRFAEDARGGTERPGERCASGSMEIPRGTEFEA